MRKQVDRSIAIGSIVAVAVVPTVLVLMPWQEFEPAGTKSNNSSPTTPADGLLMPPSPNRSPGAERAPSAAGQDPLPLPDIDTPAAGGGGGGTSGNGSAGNGRATLKPADDGARITAVKWHGKRQADVSIASPALGSTQKVRVLLPRAWSATANRTWPVLHAYHGGSDTYLSWTRSTDIEQLAAKYDVLVALPEGANGSYVDWYNDGKGGIPRWETFHTQEVRQILERNFRAGSARAAMGISSGAQGAVTYAGRYPGMFKYAGGFSGVLSMLSPGIPALLQYINARPGHDQSASMIWGDPIRDRANWVAHDPYHLAPNMRGTRIHVSSGNGSKGPLDKTNHAPWDIRYLSESQVERTNRDFVRSAKSAGVPLTTNFYGAGSHTWGYWKREMHSQWPTMMSAIRARKY
ncbi:alpha/beta hydrolase [Actinomadura sp. 9N407]|uniref:alpha/beta hydrolase n=1 Tax=Actinomadura sp. 9N407 TaxID=3375154 RepID=UPI0037B3B2D9